LAILVICGVGSYAAAALKLNPLFSNGAVLQQGQKVPIWGTADAGKPVTIHFADQTITVEGGGKWRAMLDNLKSGGPYEMTISSGDEKITLKNILVGEVWIASGQSNMQWPVKLSADAEKTIAESANPMIRLLTVPREPANEPRDLVNVAWVECNPQTVPEFSAVAYHFARELQAKLGVPVGIINTSYGGTPAEAWTSRRALEAVAELKSLVSEPPAGATAPQRPTVLYNAMIHPLIPYAIKGAIWYQGESNAGRAFQYKTLFPTMIRNWRSDWGQGDFPFLFVQLAPFYKKNDPHPEWAELREAQRLTVHAVPNTAMAVITDVGDETDIHPKQKAPVGQRLALAALALAYNRPVEYSGPEYASLAVKGNQVVLSFDHVDGGLVAQGDKLEGFTIAGKDQKFHPAQAEIQGDKVIVSSPDVPEPVAVRYGWAGYPVVNLANKAGLLASPFATDDFPWTTAPPPTAGEQK
jgi:sialate O-acetylesterase